MNASLADRVRIKLARGSYVPLFRNCGVTATAEAVPTAPAVKLLNGTLKSIVQEVRIAADLVRNLASSPEVEAI